ncbi:LuxR family transcriptional regulator [Microtetraspora sp. NBRC 13810]|uniref:LuxR C-terminal-related transcriptional regulator n=1 Tax=Microtetraspora sp. NBRC 13810 TaxID=3030990 RepID=UPI0024A5E3E8|nr:LuxR C-terminal-related transcriptional regulator [Microtetraspora sp. NBRC 13810]GLW11604.1 LuxR family transcriptional regulator [Microtetraspora sp. NBRC 13810]
MTATTAFKESRTHGLPAETTSFVGRRHEIANVKRLLSHARLMTLTGVGGVGKSRLATRVATEMRRSFPDGVWLVELAALPDPELIPENVAEALLIRHHSGRPTVDVLIDHLRDKQMLMILDNCEHVLPTCAIVAETLLRSCPKLRILATSRQALGVGGEQLMHVPTLSLPESDDVSSPDGLLVQSDAVRLFVERAGAMLPDFTVTLDNQGALIGICRRLDGIPLAIELAAVRLRALSVQQLLDRLENRSQLLTVGPWTRLPHHRTLRALIDWSYNLCTEQEKQLWARASVFSGGLDLEAAEEICAGDGIAREEVIDLIAALVDKSILTREEQPSRVRYRLLETVREYGLERLVASGEESTLRQRHRNYYRKLAAGASTQLFGPSQKTLTARLHLEHTNLRAALENHFSEPADIRRGLAMASDLITHWLSGYHLVEGRCWLNRGLAAYTEPDEVRARALWSNSWLAIYQGDIASAERMLEESRTIGETLSLTPDLAYVALCSGMAAMHQEDVQSAVTLYEDAVTRQRAAENPMGLAQALLRLSLSYSCLGDIPRAVSSAEECLRVCDAHREIWHKAYAMTALGIAVWHQGDTRRADELVKSALEIMHLIDDPLGAGLTLEALTSVTAAEGQNERAAQLLGVLHTVWRTIGVPPLAAYGNLARDHEACESRIRRDLSRTCFDAAVRRGAMLSYDEAITYALDRRTPASKPAKESGQADQLTAREIEVARLVAKGKSNKEIAASLVISQRTAEGHVERILSKLGFTSRVQVATWVSMLKQDRDEPSSSSPPNTPEVP